MSFTSICNTKANIWQTKLFRESLIIQCPVLKYINTVTTRRSVVDISITALLIRESVIKDLPCSNTRSINLAPLEALIALLLNLRLLALNFAAPDCVFVSLASRRPVHSRDGCFAFRILLQRMRLHFSRISRVFRRHHVCQSKSYLSLIRN